MTSPESGDALLRWDLTVIYPALDSAEFATGFGELVRNIANLADMFDAEGIGRDRPPVRNSADDALFDTVLAEMNRILESFGTHATYLHGFTTTDSRNQVAQARLSELQRAGVKLDQLDARWIAWIGTLDVEQLIARLPEARHHAHYLRRTHFLAQRQMAPGEEALAAALNVNGPGAWSKLHDMVTSQIEGLVEIEGDLVARPMSALRNLALSPDRMLRERAFDAEIGAWERWSTPLAAALNGVKGSGATIVERRGWDDPLELACFNSAIDREILDVMIDEARASFPDFRRYLRAKARLIGVEHLAWFDLFAPVGDPGRSWEWADAIGLLEDRFDRFSPELGDLMRRAATGGWIDAGPRSGKQGGAFCALLRDGESRVLMNFTPSFDGVSTLAHEMGHAYHNHCQIGMSPLQRQTPMTLAETASTFCETLVYDALLEAADGDEKLFMLDQSLQGSTQIVVDIVSRFDFERAVFSRCGERDLTIDEFCALMTEAQAGTYGDGLDPDRLHPLMWAVKGHYYMDGFPFYNFPYLFGLLFGLGLYDRYQQDSGDFVPRYEQLLGSTGQADAPTLAAGFGIDLRGGEFWRRSLATIRANIDEFERIVDARTGG